MQEEKCIANLEHDFQFVVAAFGQSCFQCNICGAWDDVQEDCLGG